jgi:hypothetical protein
LEDPRVHFATSVALSDSKVAQFPGYILLCGGRIASASQPAISLRDYILRHLTIKYAGVAERVVMPEELPDWGFDSVYNDIFELEQHLAALASAVVIFVESPGSIAELGAFSLLGGVKEKLMVIIHQQHAEQHSFIQLGPIRHIKSMNPSAVYAYPWETQIVGGSPIIIEKSVEPSRDLICEAIRDCLPSDRTVSSLNTKSDSHRMLLICALVDQMIGLTRTEIKSYLSQLGLEIAFAELKKYLFVLKHLKLLGSTQYGNSEYFYSRARDRFVRFAVDQSFADYDYSRLQLSMGEYYNLHDGSRSKALKHVLAELTVT